MNGVLLKKFVGSLISVFPVTVVIAAVNFLTSPMTSENFLSFIIGACLLVVGMTFYSLGVDTAMTPIGSEIGAKVTKRKSLIYILVISFILGVIITVAEPDLSILQKQSGISGLTIIIALGVGAFMVLAILRTVFGIKLKYLLLALYLIVFAVALFLSEEVIPLAFDSGGVTTGPITVPFIIALSAGIGGSLWGGDDSAFGTIGICSVGPILAVMLVGLNGKLSLLSENSAATIYNSFGEVFLNYLRSLPDNIFEVVTALAPIMIFFAIF
ncbi:MAG: DUF1538 domain-containing protein, partial [Clostridia bacterium]|nr:DUF1538 domain-containing protein [Clostridia bacterium]